MPSIKIREVDTTSAGTVLMAQDVVFVPGFINKKYIGQPNIKDAYIPTLCNTVADLEFYFGAIPAVFEENQPYLPGFSENAKSTGNMYLANEMEPGYVYAKELLNAGIPVYYVRMNEDDTDINVEHMYKALIGAVNYQLWEDLEDIGEYTEIKYLTTGGYPSFEYYAQSDLNLETEGVIASITNQTTLINKGKIDNNTDTNCKFIFADGAIVVATFAELESYKETATEDLRFYVTDENKVYKIKIPTTGDRTWEIAKAWSVYKNGSFAEEADITTYGIAVTGAPQVGGTIKVLIRVNAYSIIATKMLSCAATRGDCVALIDHTNNPSRALNPKDTHSVYYSIAESGSAYKISVNGEFGAMFTPWCGYSYGSALYDTTNGKVSTPSGMPASFGYLMALAKSVQSNANWLAIAGASRGVVNITQPMLLGSLRLSNAIAEGYQPRNAISINPITKIKPYGYIIWGNRTLKNNATEGNLVATSFLNVRNMVSDIKKVAYNAAKRCMFEQNSDILWINYKARITPTLDTLVNGAGLSGYKLIKGTTTEKAKLVCTIRIYPLYAVESFDITVELADDEVTIS